MIEERQNDKIITFDQLYRECTLKALNRTGSIKGAAQLLGVSERTVLRWKKIYGIVRDPDEPRYYLSNPLKVQYHEHHLQQS